ncbi:MAG TPA: hypothetical protein VIV40_23910 [Kofleriaceae bacterium]
MELTRSSGWRQLRRQLATGAKPFALRTALDAIAHDLVALGVEPRLVEAVGRGLEVGAWDDAVHAFSSAVDAPAGFYLGPMRAAEGEPLATGLLLLRRTRGAADLVTRIESLASPLGARLFGFPLRDHGRHVELYDALCADGPFAAGRGKYIALFTPFYLGGWRDGARQTNARRTILFHDVVRRRFDVRTRCFASRLVLDGGVPAYGTAPDEALDAAITLWLTLHELVHGSGPLPLFGAPVGKIPLGAAYGGVEEFRVDATVWLLLDTCADLVGASATLARDIVLGERLTRAARGSLDAGPSLRNDFDAEHGALWLALLHRGGAARLDAAGRLSVDCAAAAAILREVLAELYAVEDEVATGDPEIGAARLCAYADALRARAFGRADWPHLAPAAATWLRRLPSPAPVEIGVAPEKAG